MSEALGPSRSTDPSPGGATPDVSVIMPTFRRPGQLAESIASVLGQIGATVDVLVVDDSPEGSAEAVVSQVTDPRVRYLKNPVPTGGIPSIVRNLGWPMATGQYVHFLDDDDLVAEGYYAAVKAAFADRPDVGLVFGRIEPFGSGPADQLNRERAYFDSAARNARSSERFGSRWAFTARMLFDMAMLVCSASVIRRRCMPPLGGFDPGIRLMEDADFHVRAMRQFGVHYLDRPAVRYRIGYPSLMHSPNPTVEQVRAELEGRRKMQAKYRQVRGGLEFYSLALFARSILRII